MSDAPVMTAPTPGKGLAISSMILGILGFVTCALTALPGLIIGIIALAKGRPGKGMAIAGVVCSGVSFLVLPTLLTPAIANVRTMANKAKDGNNLKQIAVFAIIHAHETGAPAQDLQELQDASHGDLQERAMSCPTHRGEHGYAYFRPADPDAPLSGVLPLVMGDPDCFGAGANIAFRDGHYEWWPAQRARPLWQAVQAAPAAKAWTAAELKALISVE